MACLVSFLIARLFDHRSIYERQMGLELLEEDHLQAKNERRAFQPTRPQSEPDEPDEPDPQESNPQ